MKAAVLYALGDLPRCEEFPDPVRGEGEVLVEVRAASLKPADVERAWAQESQGRRIVVVP